MNKSQKILGAIILLLLAVSIYGFWISRDPEAAREEPSQETKGLQRHSGGPIAAQSSTASGEACDTPTSVRSPRKRCTSG